MNDSELRQAIAAATSGAVNAARSSTPQFTLRPGTVTAVDTAAPQVIVAMDGDDADLPTYCAPMNFLPTVGARVYVLFVPPQGAVVVGLMSNGDTGVGIFGPSPIDQFTAAGGANEDLTSAAFVTFPSNASWTVTPPPWANGGLFRVVATGLNFFNTSQYQLRTVWSGTAGQARTFQSTAGAGGGDRSVLVWEDEFTATGGLAGTLLLQGLRVTAVGQLRRDASSYITATVHWTP